MRGRVRRPVVVGVLVALTVLTAGLTAGCGSQRDDYCAAVEQHQEELTKITGAGGQDSLLQALDVFEDLQDQAPDDITDEWQQVVSRIEALRDALADAGVDPATYDRADPPSGLSEQDRASIDAAAEELGAGPTLAALQGLDQQARDVCHTPLTLG